MSPEDLHDFRILFRRHYQANAGEPKWNENDITSVKIAPHPAYKTICFHAQHEGEYQTISGKRLAGAPPSAWLNLMNAMRTAVRPQIVEYKRKMRRDYHCVECSTAHDQLTVDHIVPFRLLADSFIESNFPHAIATRYDDATKTHVISDEDTKASWIAYHRAELSDDDGAGCFLGLQLLCRHCHDWDNATTACR
jgi:5-methylcytosine-specific restriction endonuclease McrA